MALSPFLRRMSASRIIDHYLEGSMIAYYGEQLEEVIAAEQGDLTEEERRSWIFSTRDFAASCEKLRDLVQT